MQRCLGQRRVLELLKLLRVSGEGQVTVPLRNTATSPLLSSASAALGANIPSTQRVSMSVPVEGETSLQSMQLSLETLISQLEDCVGLDQLSETDKTTHLEHLAAIKAGKDNYEDPTTGYQVYTALSHLLRGNCCGNACRHCPYQHMNVEARYKSLKRHNGAFYC